MKRYVLLTGGTGARVADALLCAACAGVFPAEEMHILLADPDKGGVHSADQIAAQMADYARVHRILGGEGGGFRTKLSFTAWPERLPGGASTLQQWTADSEADALLCQALFDADAASLDLHEGFHGRRMLGEVTFAGLLHEADQDEDDALRRLVDGMAEAVQSGEEVRVVIVGSVSGGTGAAGIPALARYITARTQGQARLGAVLLTACSDGEDAGKARSAIARYAQDGLTDAICVLGLPQSARTSGPMAYARLTDWLAVYCTDVLLHRPQWQPGVFTVRAEEGALGWSIFGKSAARYRLAYGRLVKAAAAWSYAIGPEVEKRLQHPFFLRDKLLGWYAHFFRRMETGAEVQLEDVACLTRLCGVALLWLGGVSRSLPVDMRHASVLQSAREEGWQHYAALAELSGQLRVMDDDAQHSRMGEDSLVHRRHTMEDTEEEKALQRIDAVKAEIDRRNGAQVALNRRMGGAAVMTMLEDALAKAEDDRSELRARYEEAVRRIDHAETIASDEDQYRITDARTKLRRMERHQVLLEGKVTRIQDDLAAAQAEGVRFDKPAMTPAAAESAMFLPEMTDRLIRRERPSRKEIELLWDRIVLPEDGVSLKMALKAIRRAPVMPEAPVLSLMQALMQQAMKEVR